VQNFIVSGMNQGQVQECSVKLRHTYQLVTLPMHHRDPFDRLLIATALEEKMILLTDDVDIRKYPVQMEW
jgi:PIN domain nuclease of toxin-antitoxin system